MLSTGVKLPPCSCWAHRSWYSCPNEVNSKSLIWAGQENHTCWDVWRDESSRNTVKWRNFSSWWAGGFWHSSSAPILQELDQLPDRSPRLILGWPALTECIFWGDSDLCYSAYIATKHHLINWEINHRTLHWINATAKHIFAAKSEGWELLFLFSPCIGCLFLLKTPFKINHTCVNSVPSLFQSVSFVLLLRGVELSEINRAHLLICPSEEETLGCSTDTGGKYRYGYSAAQRWEFDNWQQRVSVKRNNCSSW